MNFAKGGKLLDSKKRGRGTLWKKRKKVLFQKLQKLLSGSC